MENPKEIQNTGQPSTDLSPFSMIVMPEKIVTLARARMVEKLKAFFKEKGRI